MGKAKTFLLQVLITIGLSVIGSVALLLLFGGIFVYSLPFTMNSTVSGILTMVITTILVVSLGTYALYKQKGRKTEVEKDRYTD